MAAIAPEEVKRLLDILDEYATGEIKRAFEEISALKKEVKDLKEKVDKLDKASKKK